MRKKHSLLIFALFTVVAGYAQSVDYTKGFSI